MSGVNPTKLVLLTGQLISIFHSITTVEFKSEKRIKQKGDFKHKFGILIKVQICTQLENLNIIQLLCFCVKGGKQPILTSYCKS